MYWEVEVESTRILYPNKSWVNIEGVGQWPKNDGIDKKRDKRGSWDLAKEENRPSIGSLLSSNSWRSRELLLWYEIIKNE